MMRHLSCKICVVGLGPAGLGTAVTLAGHQLAKEVICVEQGGLPEARRCNVFEGRACREEHSCQVISGVGGCSILSGGKVSDYPAGGGLATILGSEGAATAMRQAMGILGRYFPFSPDEVRTEDVEAARQYYSTLGFEYRFYRARGFGHRQISQACRDMYTTIASSGSNILCETALEKIEMRGSAALLWLKRRHEEQIAVEADKIVLAIGRSGRALLNRLNAQLGLRAKAGQLDIGVRLDSPSALLGDRIRGHHDLKLLFDGARTFCVCEGGRLAVYWLDGTMFTEGSSAIDGNSDRTNLGILKRFAPSEDNGSLATEIRRLAKDQRNGKIVLESLQSYLEGEAKLEQDIRCVLPEAVVLRGRVHDCFPAGVAAPIVDAVRYFAERMLPKERWREVGVLAPEVDYAGRAYPVTPDFAIRDGIYLVGDCTGLFRGIAQAFASGIVCAQNLAGAM